MQPDSANAETDSSEDKTSSLVKDKEGDTHAYAEATDMATGEPALINNTAKLVKDGNSTALNSTKGEVEANSSTNNTTQESKTPKAVSSGDGKTVIVMETPDNTTHSGTGV